MYCVKCGKQLNENEKFCSNCGEANKILEDNNNQQNNSIKQNNVVQPKENDGATLLCILSLTFMYFAPGIIVAIGENHFPNIDSLGGLFPLVALVLMIVARVKYPNSTFAKVIMWIYIIQIILAIIGFILLVAFCYIMCGDCQELGSMGMILWK